MSDQRTSENHSRDLTWRDYDPQGGMPLVTGDISASDLHEILGRDVDPEVGNWILRLVNYRRQSGSLIESGVSFPSDQGISTNVAHKALEYLRRIQPELDEQEAGRIWAQEQLEMLEEEYVERAQSSILYEKTPDIQSPREEESVLINTRKANAAALRESDAAEKAAAKASDLAASQATQRADGDKSSQKMVTVAQDALKAKQMTNRAPVPKAWLQPAKRKEWVKQYEQKAQVLDDQPVQKIPAIRRLGPSAFVTLLTLSGCVYLHAHYDPTLDPLGRVFPNVSSTTATIGALVAIMTTAFVAYRMPPLWRIFNTYFVTIPAAPAASSMILAIFTHRSLSHLLVNCAMLAAFGRFLHEDVGRGTFLAIFFGTGACASFASLANRVYLQQWMMYSFGASGAIAGVVAAACLLRSDSDVKIFGYRVPVTGAMVLGGVIGIEILGATWLRGANSVSVDYIGHLVGYAGGALSAWLITRQNRAPSASST